MKPRISPALLQRFSAHIAGRMGLHFPAQRWDDLERGVCEASLEQGYADVAAYLLDLLKGPTRAEQIQALAKHLTVGETSFFRDNHSLEALQRTVLPGIIAARRGREQYIRVWSAGCCTGEEPYTLAILLARLLPDLAEWRVTILGTDINPAFLERARAGVYSAWSFRGAPQWAQARFFERHGSGRLTLRLAIKSMVTFSYLNLADDCYPALLNDTQSMDVILCRNVLMYLTPDCASQVMGRLQRSLAEGGWLILSPAEAVHAHVPGLAAMDVDGAPVFRKGRESAPAQPSPPLTPAAAATMPAGKWQPMAGLASAAATDAERCAKEARRLADCGELAAARDWCQRAIAADKMNPVYHYLHATILKEEGQLREAAAALRRVLYLDANHVLAHVALGALAQREQAHQEAHRHFRHALVLLEQCPPDGPLPDGDGMTARRLAEIVQSFDAVAPG
jgi:chemotaxis protein methyltransferase CheR